MKIRNAYVLLSIGFLLSSCISGNGVETAEPTSAVPAGEPQTVTVTLDYGLLPRSQMIEAADAIFAAVVEDISTTVWNQDNGEYWVQESNGVTLTATPLHRIEVAVVEVLKDEVGLGKTAVLTISGKSPADDGQVYISDLLSLGGTADHDLEVGEQILLFVTEENFGWWGEDEQMEYDRGRGGFFGATRPVLTFANHPMASFLRFGFDELYHPQPPAEEYGDGPISLDDIVAEINSSDT